MQEKNSCNCGCKPFGLVAIVVVIILAIGLCLNSGFSDKNITVNTSPDAHRDILTVNGTVNKLVSPDEVQINLSIETLAATASESQTQNADLASKVKRALKESGVPESKIETSNYTVNEEFRWDDSLNKSVSIGYRTINSMKVTLSDLEVAGEIIDAAVSAGANRVSSVVFTLSKEKEQQVRLDAIKEAAASAKLKATSMAQGIGVTLGKVSSVIENSYYFTPNYTSYDMVKASGSAESAPTPINPSDVQVSASVTVEFELA